MRRVLKCGGYAWIGMLSLFISGCAFRFPASYEIRGAKRGRESRALDGCLMQDRPSHPRIEIADVPGSCWRSACQERQNKAS